MTSTGRALTHGGRRMVAAVCGALVLLGLLIVGAALLAQEPAPPQAPTTGSGEEQTSPESDEQMEAAIDPLPRSEPTTISAPDLGIESTVFPISLAEDGTLAVPTGERRHDAAWFDGSPTPGEAGPSVIEGHVTYSGEPSVFFELGDARPGDRVEVARQDGSIAVFEVYDVVRETKEEFPTWAVYGNTEEPELRLITCGGEVDADGRHADNVIVFARLVQEA